MEGGNLQGFDNAYCYRLTESHCLIFLIHYKEVDQAFPFSFVTDAIVGGIFALKRWRCRLKDKPL